LQELLGREDAIQRITGMLIDRDHLLVHGHDPTSEPGEDDRTTRRMTAIAGGLLSGKKFSELALVLKAHFQKERKRWRQSGNVPDVTLYGMLRALQRFWWKLPGYRERAKSDELNFLQRVVAFIDPAAVSKVPSAMRRRVKLDPPL
jgi:hypothetical protein